MSKDNKWKKPDAPPPPMFFGKKERDLVKQINDEVIERVVGQQILYFPLDISLLLVYVRSYRYHHHA